MLQFNPGLVIIWTYRIRLASRGLCAASCYVMSRLTSWLCQCVPGLVEITFMVLRLCGSYKESGLWSEGIDRGLIVGGPT